eukprot:scaffold1954_cov268-Pinguiococcus_pyrenoidosus.AAC.237
MIKTKLLQLRSVQLVVRHRALQLRIQSVVEGGVVVVRGHDGVHLVLGRRGRPLPLAQRVCGLLQHGLCQGLHVVRQLGIILLLRLPPLAHLRCQLPLHQHDGAGHVHQAAPQAVRLVVETRAPHPGLLMPRLRAQHEVTVQQGVIRAIQLLEHRRAVVRNLDGGPVRVAADVDAESESLVELG